MMLTVVSGLRTTDRVTALRPVAVGTAPGDSDLNPHVSTKPVACDFAYSVGVQLGVGGGT